MALRIALDPVERLNVMAIDAGTLAARRQIAADVARAGLEEALRRNEAALGFRPDFEVTVDGRRDVPFEAVNPDRGSIIIEFNIVPAMLHWIARMLLEASPVKKGDYQAGHTLFVDGVATLTAKQLATGAQASAGETYAFVATVPYARRLENGKDRKGRPFVKQVPPHICERVAKEARRKYAHIATIRFNYIALAGANNTRTDRRSGHRLELLFPTIIIQPK
jgi:hypothetical protein